MKQSTVHLKPPNEILRNAIIIAAMVLLTFGLLLALGIIHLSAPGFGRIRQTVEPAADPAVMVAGDDSALRKKYGIPAREVAEFVYYAPKSAMDASEILILKATDEALLPAWRAAIDARRQTRADMYRNYRPEEALLLENSELRVQGSYLIFISAAKVNEIKAAVNASFR